MNAWYNEFEPFAAKWLENLAAAGHINPGTVDSRSIKEVSRGDVSGATQAHFFAGIGVWSHALRLAGWPDDRPVWTGSCPCQPFSVAGRGLGIDDPRHLWPVWFELIKQCRPPVVFGEQVASADGRTWLDAVRADLEGVGYAFGAADLCAAGIGAPHIRQRLYFVGVRLADADSAGWRELGGSQLCEDERPLHGSTLGQRMGEPIREGLEGHTRHGDDGHQPGRNGAQPFGPTPTSGFWGNPDWVACRDGKQRPVEPGSFPLAHGASARVGRLRAYGNAIVSEVAATFIKAVMEHLDSQ